MLLPADHPARTRSPAAILAPVASEDACSLPVILALVARIHVNCSKAAAHEDVDRRNECGDDG
jgi:hypothetical protein